MIHVPAVLAIHENVVVPLVEIVTLGRHREVERVRDVRDVFGGR